MTRATLILHHRNVVSNVNAVGENYHFSQVTFISVTLYTMQIVSKQLHRKIAESIIETQLWRKFRFCCETSINMWLFSVCLLTSLAQQNAVIVYSPISHSKPCWILFDFTCSCMYWWQVYFILLFHVPPQNLLNLICIQTFKTCCLQHVWNQWCQVNVCWITWVVTTTFMWFWVIL